MVCDIRLSVHPFTLLETLVWSMIFTLKFPQKLRISQPCLSWKVIQLLIVVAHIYIHIYIYVPFCHMLSTPFPHAYPIKSTSNRGIFQRSQRWVLRTPIWKAGGRSSFVGSFASSLDVDGALGSPGHSSRFTEEKFVKTHGNFDGFWWI